MQGQMERMRQMSGMQRNVLCEDVSSAAMRSAEESEESAPLSPFPEHTPPGIAYVPFQQWEEPYDTETAFPVGTIFPSLDDPYRGGGSCA